MLRKTLQTWNLKGAAVVAAVGLLVWGFGATARASLILPGQSDVATTGVAPVGGPSLAFSPVPFTGEDFSHTVWFTGDLLSTVYSDPNNPFAPGDLDFVYQFTNNASSPGDIEVVSVTSFAGYQTNADFQAGTGAGIPGSVSRDPNAGDTITWTFSPDVAPNSTSVDLVVYTNATNITMGTFSLLGSGVATVSAPVPVAVPEPATFAIAGFALLGMGMRRRNRA